MTGRQGVDDAFVSPGSCLELHHVNGILTKEL